MATPEDARSIVADAYIYAYPMIDNYRTMVKQTIDPEAPEYIGGFKGTPPPDEARRVRRVLMTDVTGDVAIAKVELDYPDTRFVDYFTLAKLGGDWKIIHKTFQRFPKPAAGSK